MLTRLWIKNLILIEDALLEFSSGFHVISGETGSGKTAIVRAIDLLLGVRADCNLIRTGEEKAFIEGVFELDGSSCLLSPLFEGLGLAVEKGEPVVIKRIIEQNGRGKAFVNQQSVTVSNLKEIVSPLIQIAGQQASEMLLQTHYHRKCLDLCAIPPLDLVNFQKSFSKEKGIKDQLCEMAKQMTSLEAQRSSAACELEEIRSVNPRLGEDSELFDEYTRHTHFEEIYQLLSELNRLLEQLSGLTNDACGKMRALSQLDSSLIKQLGAAHSIHVEVSDFANEMRAVEGREEKTPDKAALLHERLQEIERLKKRFGGSVESVLAHKLSLEQFVNSETECREKIKTLEEQLFSCQERTNCFSHKLSQARKKGAQKFAEAVNQYLKKLNLPDAKFTVCLQPTKRGYFGDEEVEFVFSPNPGEKEVSIRNCASGGERSRVCLAIQALLSKEHSATTLLFDEIDGNVGGTTAGKMGQVLSQMGVNQQVIAISHFPQLAEKADHHFKVEKQIKEGRTFSSVRKLSRKQVTTELARMVGVC